MSSCLQVVLNMPRTQTGVIDLNEYFFLSPLDLICSMLIWLSVAATAKPESGIMSATGNKTNTKIYVNYQHTNTFTQSPSLVRLLHIVVSGFRDHI